MPRRLTQQERERRWTWQGVVRIANTWEGQRRSNQRALEAFGPHGRMKLLPNNMASGPCAACLAYVDRLQPIPEVPLMPLVDCAHPDQCACIWQPVLDLDGEPEPSAADLSLAAKLIRRMFGD